MLCLLASLCPRPHAKLAPPAVLLDLYTSEGQIIPNVPNDLVTTWCENKSRRGGLGTRVYAEHRDVFISYEKQKINFRFVFVFLFKKGKPFAFKWEEI